MCMDKSRSHVTVDEKSRHANRSSGRAGLSQPVIIGVTANPVPYNAISLHDRQGAVPEADSRRIDIVVAFEFFELKTGMPWIALKDSIGALGAPLDIQRQIGEQPPEFLGDPRLHLQQVAEWPRFAPLIFLEGFPRH